MKDLLADLNEEQKKVVQATHGPVLVLAGAGSGKTRALTYRMAYLIQQRIARPQEIMAVTFTNKAAGEMKERVSRLLAGVAPTPSALGTFHSLGARLLRQHAEAKSRSRRFTILDTDDSERLVRLAMDQLSISRKQHNARNVRQRISQAKNALRTPAMVAKEARRPDDEVVATVFARYEKLLAEHDAYDFDDLLGHTIGLLERNAAIRQRYHNQWRWLSVDEYQDTNPMQEMLLQLLVGEERNICVVGDDYQAIYSWRGARVDHILSFAEHYPDCTTVYLTQNYRSTPAILDAAGAVIAENTQQMHKQLWTAQTGGTAVRLLGVPTSRAEAKMVRELVEQTVVAGGRRRDCAVLYRTNAQSRALEEEFLTHGVPYTIVGGFRFYERREIKEALALLQLWVSPRSRLALQRLAGVLWRGVGERTLAKWDAAAREQDVSYRELLAREAARRPVVRPVLTAYRNAEARSWEIVADLLEFLLEKSGYAAWLKRQPDGEERWENVEELLAVTAGYADPARFLEEVALLTDIDTLEQEHDRVTCMTLHAAKGLEFPVVFVVGLEDGLLPHQSSIGQRSELEEERRLLYVGMTRAQEQLVLTYAQLRYVHGDWVSQVPSRFLEALPAEVQFEDVTEQEDGAGESLLDTLAVPETESDEPVTIAVDEGDFISHEKFGRGVVIGTRGSVVTCVFENYGVKQLDATTVMAQ